MCSKLRSTPYKALLCANASSETASKQLPSAFGFAALRAGKHPKGLILRKPNFLAPFTYNPFKEKKNMLLPLTQLVLKVVEEKLYNLCSLGLLPTNFQ